MENVAGQAFGMHAREDGVAVRDITDRQRHMVPAVEGLVSDRDELAVARGKFGHRLRFASHEGLVAPPVSDEVCDRDQLETVMLGHVAELWQACHRPVGVHDLADDPRRV